MNRKKLINRAEGKNSKISNESKQGLESALKKFFFDERNGKATRIKSELNYISFWHSNVKLLNMKLRGKMPSKSHLKPWRGGRD